jgi:hypothetical protein
MGKRKRDGQKRAGKVAVRRRRRQRDLVRDQRGDDRATDEMLESIRTLLRATVAATLEQLDPDIARTRLARVAEVDAEIEAEGLDDRAPGQWFADLALTTWLMAAGRSREEGGLAHPVLAWVVANLGPVGSALERIAVGLLDEPHDMEAVQGAIDELDDDFLPSLVWLAAGAVAVAGDGDVTWLDRLDGARPATGS